MKVETPNPSTGRLVASRNVSAAESTTCGVTAASPHSTPRMIALCA
ncbi:MAG TPA: hypothetical protein VH044_10365 [Polyangiaceae bacterium]|jgi:hypothetical protein|nr:hypothetical protein [Polyangiaceae bacterium]